MQKQWSESPERYCARIGNVDLFRRVMDSSGSMLDAARAEMSKRNDERRKVGWPTFIVRWGWPGSGQLSHDLEVPDESTARALRSDMQYAGVAASVIVSLYPPVRGQSL